MTAHYLIDSQPEYFLSRSKGHLWWRTIDDCSFAEFLQKQDRGLMAHIYVAVSVPNSGYVGRRLHIFGLS